MTDARQNSASFSAYVDRVEGELAVIVLDGDDGFQFDLPLGRLPVGAKAGDHLLINIQLDQEGAEAALRRVAELQQELKQRSALDTTEFKL